MMKNFKVEPMPCPFCGGHAAVKQLGEEGGNRWIITCGTEPCYGEAPAAQYAKREFAVAEWNKRSDKVGQQIGDLFKKIGYKDHMLLVYHDELNKLNKAIRRHKRKKPRITSLAQNLIHGFRQYSNLISTREDVGTLRTLIDYTERLLARNDRSVDHWKAMAVTNSASHHVALTQALRQEMFNAVTSLKAGEKPEVVANELDNAARNPMSGGFSDPYLVAVTGLTDIMRHSDKAITHWDGETAKASDRLMQVLAHAINEARKALPDVREIEPPEDLPVSELVDPESQLAPASPATTSP